MNDRSMTVLDGQSCRRANPADELEAQVVFGERRQARHLVRVEVELAARGKAERPGGRVVRAGDHNVRVPVFVGKGITGADGGRMVLRRQRARPRATARIMKGLVTEVRSTASIRCRRPRDVPGRCSMSAALARRGPATVPPIRP